MIPTKILRRRGDTSAAASHFKARAQPAWSVALCLLLLAEGLLLGVSYDGDALRRLPQGWWSGLLAAASGAMPLAAAVVTAGLLVAGPRISRRLREAPATLSPHAPLLLLAHLACFVALYAVCGRLFPHADHVPQHPGPWVLAGVALAGAAAATWAFALLPPRVLRVLLAETWGLLFLSLTIGVAAWAFGRYTQDWWAVLRGPTLGASLWLLRLWEPDVFADPANYILGAGNFRVQITTPCSGYEGVGLVWVFLATYFWLFRTHLRFPQALLLIPVATAAVWFANVARIAVLVSIGAHASPAVALGGFHSYAGSLLFCAIALACAAVGHRSSFFTRGGVAEDDPVPPADGAVVNTPAATHWTANPAAPYLVPFLAVVASGLVTGALSAGPVDPLYGVRVLAALALLWHYRANYLPMVEGLRDRRGVAAAVFIGATVAVVWVALTLAAHPSAARPDEGPARLPGYWGAAWVAARCVGAIVVAPVVEELAFRGYLARRLMAADFESVSLGRLTPFALLASSGLFAALHGQFLGGLAAGLAYGWAARRRGKLVDAVVAHAVTNALLVAYALPTGAWGIIG